MMSYKRFFSTGLKKGMLLLHIQQTVYMYQLGLAFYRVEGANILH